MTTILKPRWLVSMAPGTGTLTEHALVIEGERIAAVLPWAEAEARYPQAERVELGEHVLIPGLINGHTHSAMSLLRGGVTYLNDMYFFPTAMARAALDSGIRAGVSINVIDFPTGYAANAQDYIAKGLAAYEQFKGEKLLDWTSAPHAPYTVSDETFVALRKLAEAHDLQIHCHIHETQDEIDGSLKQYGVRPLERLHKLGLLDERMIAVHMVHLNEAEIALMAEKGVHLVHNPNSNLKLASGIQPLRALEAAGVNTLLGTDGAASNNRQDMFGEIRSAALLAKGASGDPVTVTARTALEMATIRAAKAMGRGDDLGSLEVGKLADVTAVSLSALECQPVYDPAAQLVYVAGREHVSDVWVGGRRLLKNREITSFDAAATVRQANEIVTRMKAGR